MPPPVELVVPLTLNVWLWFPALDVVVFLSFERALPFKITVLDPPLLPFGTVCVCAPSVDVVPLALNVCV